MIADRVRGRGIASQSIVQHAPDTRRSTSERLPPMPPDIGNSNPLRAAEQRTETADRQARTSGPEHCRENRNGKTPVISGQRGMIGRPRESISIGLPVRRDFSSARGVRGFLVAPRSPSCLLEVNS